MEIGSAKRAAHDRRDRPGAREAPTRRPHAEKDAPHGAGWPISAKIRRQRRPYICGQGEAIVSKPFLSPNGDLTQAPVDIIELERHHLAGTKPETREEQQDGVIAASGSRLPIARPQEPLDLLCGD